MPKTRNAVREIPLAPQMVALLAEHRRASGFACDRDWVFCTRNGTPLGQRNVQRSALRHAARAAGLLDDGARLRFHDLRHTHASHLIIDLRLDVVQVSRILGHGSTSTTLDIYTHMFDKARHASQIREQMARSAFAELLDPTDDDHVIRLPAAARSSPAHAPRSARERAALRWGT